MARCVAVRCYNVKLWLFIIIIIIIIVIIIIIIIPLFISFLLSYCDLSFGSLS